jgi:hypothetical protein
VSTLRGETQGLHARAAGEFQPLDR